MVFEKLQYIVLNFSHIFGYDEARKTGGFRELSVLQNFAAILQRLFLNLVLVLDRSEKACNI